MYYMIIAKNRIDRPRSGILHCNNKFSTLAATKKQAKKNLKIWEKSEKIEGKIIYLSSISTRRIKFWYINN